ncbi:hypothetical protein CSUB01_00058 [Colletotrichum sublineola]|uniref:Uncharacterized protein n=1 Tax=Colletotrichum sublineola TaxID=1173701 RepID=A0A066Y2C3_COLSU|nr:hypothetical protein CSUB01_00058 [Colletotrichum sublineola]
MDPSSIEASRPVREAFPFFPSHRTRSIPVRLGAALSSQRPCIPVQRFCADEVTDASLNASDDPTAMNGRYARDARFRYRDEAGVNHDFGISWEAGCKINLPSQSLRFPFGKEGRWKEPLSCQKLLRRTADGPPHRAATDMSATTPNEPAPGVHAGDSSGIHETPPLGGNQHVPLQNTDTHDMAAAHNNVGTGQQEHHHHHHQHPQQKHQKHHKGEISAIVDTVVNKALGFGGASKAEKRKSLGAT